MGNSPLSFDPEGILLARPNNAINLSEGWTSITDDHVLCDDGYDEEVDRNGKKKAGQNKLNTTGKQESAKDWIKARDSRMAHARRFTSGARRTMKGMRREMWEKEARCVNIEPLLLI